MTMLSTDEPPSGKLNAASPINVTLSGIVKTPSRGQFWNAKAPIVSSLLLKQIDARAVPFIVVEES